MLNIAENSFLCSSTMLCQKLCSSILFEFEVSSPSVLSFRCCLSVFLGHQKKSTADEAVGPDSGRGAGDAHGPSGAGGMPLNYPYPMGYPAGGYAMPNSPPPFGYPDPFAAFQQVSYFAAASGYLREQSGMGMSMDVACLIWINIANYRLL